MRIALVIVVLSVSPYTFAQVWSPLGQEVDGVVRYIYEDISEERLIVCGHFATAGGVMVDGIASWDGTSWDSLATGISNNNVPIAACRFQGELFSEGIVVDGRNSVLRLSEIGWVEVGVTWNGPTHRLRTIGNKMYALGTFDSIAGVEAANIASWDGVAWEAVGNDLNATSIFPIALNDIAEYQGELYVVGKFDDGQGLANVAKLVNGVWQAVGNGIETWDGWGAELLVFKDQLYIAGFFQDWEGNVASNVMAWNGTEWVSPLGGVKHSNGQGFVRSLSSDENYLYVGGTFDIAGGIEATGLARWDGENWCAINAQILGSVQALVHFQDKLIVAGSFFAVNDSSITHIAQADYYVDSCGSVGITEVGMDLIDIRPFPNPTTSSTTLTWQGQNQGNYQLQLYDVHGRLLFNETVPSAQGSKQLDMSSYAKGIYFGRLAVGEETRSFKVVRE